MEKEVEKVATALIDGYNGSDLQPGCLAARLRISQSVSKSPVIQ
jgi:hypothetical protein